MTEYTRAQNDEPPTPTSGEDRDGRDNGFIEALAKLRAVVDVVGHILFYVALPASLAWVVGSSDGLGVFTGFESPSLRRVAGLGVFLSAVAAIITTESVTRLARPFGVGNFVMTAFAIGLALFPSLADSHRVRLGLTVDQFALLQSYCYLGMRVMVGILIGGILSWVLLARPASYSPRYTRK